MHLLGGISVAAGTMTAMQYARQKQWLGSTHPLLLMFLIVAIVGFAAIGWEFFEFILDDAFRTYMQPSVADTMGDLLCGLIGGAIIAVSKILFTQSTKRGL